jgi:L-2-hydroxycarboxylate dehydrogenase (NAD+)
VGERYRSEDLREFMAAVLRVLGLPAGDAAIGAAVVADADLAGVDTHGIVNFVNHLHYAPGLRSGAVRPRPAIEVLRDSPVAAAWDSGRGFGPVVAHRAMQAAIAKAEQAGIGMVTVRNGCHFGANGYFAEMAAERGHMAMVAANGMPVAFPPGALAPATGTNPFAFAAPVAGAPPLVVDIAMTAAAGSKIEAARRAGRPVPEGWIVDSDGQPTTDPAAVRSGGGYLPLGGPAAGHKGFGLGLMVDALAILSGSGSGTWQRYSPEWAQGQWFAAWRIDLFIDPGEFGAEMARVAEHVHRLPALPGVAPTIPGERRAATRSERTRLGVPLEPELIAQLEELAGATGVKFPRAVR